MDRRQQKTRKAIFKAFRALLEKKRYDHITVQEIIDEANVGRSTFYAHFETKDLLLEAMCGDLFYHIFQSDPCPFSGKDNDLQGKLAHVLWHIRDSKNDLSGILLSDSGVLFMQYFKEHLKQLFAPDLEQLRGDVPADFALNHLIGSFAETVSWWMRENLTTEPETVATYFMSLTNNNRKIYT